MSLVGVVSDNPMMLLVSFCEHGSLLDLLRERAKDQLASRMGKGYQSADRLKMMLEIAKGMEHLSEHFVHRDLAARNILVDSALVCRVADFGLSRGYSADVGPDEGESYYRSTAGMFPIRTTAPEAMLQQKFTQASDVWSYALLAVEIYTDGERPYNAISNADVPMQVCSGLRPGRPLQCDDQLVWALIESCWAALPAKRPTFSAIVSACSQIQAHGSDAAQGYIGIADPDDSAADRSVPLSPPTARRPTLNEYVDMNYLPGGDGNAQGNVADKQASRSSKGSGVGVQPDEDSSKSWPTAWGPRNSLRNTSDSRVGEAALQSPNPYHQFFEGNSRRSATSPALLASPNVAVRVSSGAGRVVIAGPTATGTERDGSSEQAAAQESTLQGVAEEVDVASGSDVEATADVQHPEPASESAVQSPRRRRSSLV